MAGYASVSEHTLYDVRSGFGEPFGQPPECLSGNDSQRAVFSSASDYTIRTCVTIGDRPSPICLSRVTRDSRHRRRLREGMGPGRRGDVGLVYSGPGRGNGPPTTARLGGQRTRGVSEVKMHRRHIGVRALCPRTRRRMVAPRTSRA